MTDHMTPLRAYDHMTAGHAIAARQLGLSVTEVTLDRATTMTPQSHSGRGGSVP